MKRTLILSALIVAAWLGTGTMAQAGDWGFRFGIGRDGLRVGVGYDRSHRHRRHYRRRHHRGHRQRHVCVRSPRYGRVWTEPVYDRVIVGYERCGRPIFRRVCVRAGYYRQTISGYGCNGCGRTW